MNLRQRLAARLQRKLAKLQQQRRDGERDDSGVQLAELLVYLVVVALIIGGGVIVFTQVIGGAQESVLETNIQTAAELIRNPQIDLDNETQVGSSSVGADGVPSQAWLDAITARLSNLTFNTRWEMGADDANSLIRVQFIVDDTATLRDTSGAADTTAWAGGNPATAKLTPSTADAADGTNPPEVAWVNNDHSALRIHARDGDRWACALIVLDADFGYNARAAGATAGFDHIDVRTSHAGPATGTHQLGTSALTIAQARNRVLGIWYDQGDTIGGDGGLHHCSPVHGLTGSVDMAELPTANAQWDMRSVNTATVDDITMRRNFG